MREKIYAIFSFMSTSEIIFLWPENVTACLLIITVYAVAENGFSNI